MAWCFKLCWPVAAPANGQEWKRKEEKKCLSHCGATSTPYLWQSLSLPSFFSSSLCTPKGFSHELLQECGVFLVSGKLIVMSHKNGVSARLAEQRLERIQNLLQTTREPSA